MVRRFMEPSPPTAAAIFLLIETMDTSAFEVKRMKPTSDLQLYLKYTDMLD